MSMPSIHLDCNKCEHHGCTSVTWGLYSYLIGDKEIPINRTLGWCKDCNGFKPIESFDPDESLNEIKASNDILKKLESNLLLNLLSSSRKNQINYYHDQVEKHTMMLYIISKRVGTEKCLECGSSAVIPFDGDCDLEYESGLFQGLKMTGFIHPDCGGEFIATPNPIRYHMRFTPKHYNINGCLIQSTSS